MNTVERQVEIMEKQLSNFDSLKEKMQYMNGFFDPDPDFTREARDIVRSNIARSLAEKEKGALRGFGTTFDCVTGRARKWYVVNGIKRWSDNDEICTA